MCLVCDAHTCGDEMEMSLLVQTIKAFTQPEVKELRVTETSCGPGCPVQHPSSVGSFFQGLKLKNCNSTRSRIEVG